MNEIIENKISQVSEDEEKYQSIRKALAFLCRSELA